MLVMFLLAAKKEKKRKKGVPRVIQGKSCVNMQKIKEDYETNVVLDY